MALLDELRSLVEFAEESEAKDSLIACHERTIHLLGAKIEELKARLEQAGGTVAGLTARLNFVGLERDHFKAECELDGRPR